MKLHGAKILNDFKTRHADARSQIESWKAEVEEAQWQTPNELKQKYAKASFVGKYVIFDICGNKYRLLTQVSYKNAMVLAVKIGTHKEYDRWNITG